MCLLHCTDVVAGCKPEFSALPSFPVFEVRLHSIDSWCEQCRSVVYKHFNISDFKMSDDSDKGVGKRQTRKDYNALSKGKGVTEKEDVFKLQWTPGRTLPAVMSRSRHHMSAT